MSNILQKRLGPFSLGRWLQLLFVMLVGSVILSYIQPQKTNRSYLQELIDTGSVDKAAITYLAATKKGPTDSSITETEWAQIENVLSQCMVKEAKSYVSSEDTYLQARANKDTPMVFLKRFLKTCGVPE
jgi:hypothetical protein